MNANPHSITSLIFIALLMLAAPQSPAENTPPTTAKLVLGAGCFWCVEAIYERVPGVISAVSGYAGGKTENPTYEAVCSKTTGHAEVVEITYDPAKITIPELLKYFWDSHDPTDGRGVAPDFGSSYRPILLYKNEEERAAFQKSKDELAAKIGKPIGAEIVPLEKFWPAEEYHQDFVKRNPNHPYVRSVSLPRVRETGLD